MTDLNFSEAAAPFIGPRLLRIEIDMVPYKGPHTRRAVKAAMTRAGVDFCVLDFGSIAGPVLGYRASDLAHVRLLG
jgi:hypothetical protein